MNFRPGKPAIQLQRKIWYSPLAKLRAIQFAREVRAEAEKVTWPTRKEVGVTSLMVFIMVAFCAVFFMIADQIILRIVSAVIGIGS